VFWKVLAKSGYTARTVCDLLVPQIPTEAFDLIVIGLGGNDTFKLNSPGKWRKDFMELIQQIRQRQPQSKIVIINVPPVGNFPAFPKLMQIILGNLVRLHGKAIRDFPQLYNQVHYMELSQVEGKSMIDDFFSDGVHPAPITYAIWGKEIAHYIINHQIVR